MTPQTASAWGTLATSILAQLLFAGCLIVAFFMRDMSLLLLVVGAVIANATTVVQYRGRDSQRKDDTISRMKNADADAPPVAIAINNPEPATATESR